MGAGGLEVNSAAVFMSIVYILYSSHAFDLLLLLKHVKEGIVKIQR